METGPDRAVHGVVRLRRDDLQRLVAERFSVEYRERTYGSANRSSYSNSPTSNSSGGRSIQSHPPLSLHSARGDGGLERREVARVLVGIGLGEQGHRPVEDIGLAEISTNGDPVARAGMGACERPAAGLPVGCQGGGLIASITSELFQSFSWRT